MNLIILFSLLFSCKANYTGLKLHEKIAETVKLDETVLEYSNSQLEIDEISLFISNQTIPFNLNSLEIDVIKKKYIKDFNVFSRHSGKELEIINKVSDSLLKRDEYLNKGFKSKNIKSSTGISEANYVLFFSDIIDNSIYAKLLPYNDKINNINDLSSTNQGTGFTFLFKLDNKKNIIEKYSGVIHLN